MKTLVHLFALTALATACGKNPRLVDTWEPDLPDASTDSPPDAGSEPEPEPYVDAGTPPDGRCSIDGWCRDALLPDGGPITTRHLRAVFARAHDEVYVVGDYGTMLIWNGVEWRQPVGLRPADDFFAVWASGPTDVWVAGFIGDPEQPVGMYAHFDGTQFDQIIKPLAKRPEGLFGFAKDDVWSVGTGGELRHWTGTSWSMTSGPTTEALSDVAGGGGKLWAVGASGTVLERDAMGWRSATPALTIGGLAAIVAFSPTRAYAAGGAEWLEYDGVAWTKKQWPNHLNLQILGLWGKTPQRLWAVGPAGGAWKLEDGVMTPSDTGTTALLRDIHGFDERFVWAVGFDGTVLRRYGP